MKYWRSLKLWKKSYKIKVTKIKYWSYFRATNYITISEYVNNELRDRIATQGKLIEKLLKIDCECNLTTIENTIRDNGIAIAENKFVIGIHRDRINENEENIQLLNNHIETVDQTIISNQADIQVNKNEIATLSEAIASNQNNIATNQNSVALINVEISSIQGTIGGIQNTIAKNNRKIVFSVENYAGDYNGVVTYDRQIANIGNGMNPARSW